MSRYSICPDGLTVYVYIQPGARKSEIDGEYDGRLKIRIASPPVDGKANKELVKYVAAYLKISKSRVLLVKGDKSRLKEIFLYLESTEIDDVLKKLNLKG